MRSYGLTLLLLLAVPVWAQTVDRPAAASAPRRTASSISIASKKSGPPFAINTGRRIPAAWTGRRSIEEYRPRIDKAANIEEVRGLLKDMLSRLHQTHFGILPSTIYAAVEDFEAVGDGSTGIDLRVLDGQAMVTRVDPGSPAEHAGVKPGWAILSRQGLEPARQRREPTGRRSLDPRNHLTHACCWGASAGPSAERLRSTFLDQAGAHRDLTLPLAPERGEPSTFGNLPETRVWFESRHIGGSPAVPATCALITFWTCRASWAASATRSRIASNAAA